MIYCTRCISDIEIKVKHTCRKRIKCFRFGHFGLKVRKNYEILAQQLWLMLNGQLADLLLVPKTVVSISIRTLSCETNTVGLYINIGLQ